MTKINEEQEKQIQELENVKKNIMDENKRKDEENEKIKKLNEEQEKQIQELKEINENILENNIKKKKKKKEKEKEITTIQKCKIIEYLANEFGGNAHDKGIVKVTASSIYNNLYRAKKVVDFNNDKYFYSKNEKNSWLMYDFINRKVLPTRYLITTANWNCDMPRNWVIEGSNNNEEWDVLDSRQNDVSLKEVNVTGKFIIESQEKSYRYLRIRQTGLNSGNNAVLAFSSLEFIGTLSQNE